MTKCKFVATIKKVASAAPEEGNQAMMLLTLTMAEANQKALSALTANDKTSLEALDSTSKAGGKIEIPCQQEACLFSVTVGNKTFEQLGTQFQRVLMDTRGGVLGIRVDVAVPKTVEGWKFFGQFLGGQADFAAVPQQAKIGDDEPDRVPPKLPAKAEK